MFKKFQLLNNGQQLQQDDVNLLGEVAALAEDYVFAELFRMTPYNGTTVTKAILPYGHQTSGKTATVAPSGLADGRVTVNPFRAFVSSRTAVASEAQENWRDVRSVLAVEEGDTALTTSIQFAANSSGNARWDLVYAAVEVEKNATGVTRKTKNPTTKVISSGTVVVTKVMGITLDKIAGTPHASPAWPAITADSGSTYYIPLAYVRIPNGFTSGSTIAVTDIADIAPVLRLSQAVGGSSIEVANSHYTSGSSYLTTARIANWGATGTRPALFLPSTITGWTSVLVAADLTTGSESHANGAIVDTRDWRNRFVRYMAVVAPASSTFRWNDAISGIPATSQGSFADRLTLDATTNRVITGLAFTAGTIGFAHLIHDVVGAGMANNSTIGFELNASGQLLLTYTTAPNVVVLYLLEFSGPWGNGA